VFRRLRAIAGPLLGLVLFSAAIVLLAREARDISWDDFVAGATGAPPLYLGFAAILVAMNYCLLMTYDMLALRYICRSLPLRRVALVGFLGYSLGNNLGAVAAGTPIRFRLYSLWGLTPKQIMAILVMLMLTFWSGMSLLAGTVLVMVPIPLPDEISLPFSTRTFGGLLLGGAVGYALLCYFWRRPLPIAGMKLKPPTIGLMALQASVAALDLTISAVALYLVLPAEVQVPFALVLAAYLLGLSGSLITQVPGGLVVLELILMKLLGGTVGATLIGSLLIFRLLYYVAPLIVGVIVLAVSEVLRNRAARRAADQSSTTPAVDSLI
jgi:uncharacterized membrane protein YbhN (UPF0104 family)